MPQIIVAVPTIYGTLNPTAFSITAIVCNIPSEPHKATEFQIACLSLALDRNIEMRTDVAAFRALEIATSILRISSKLHAGYPGVMTSFDPVSSERKM